jgi:hypothetical protein
VSADVCRAPSPFAPLAVLVAVYSQGTISLGNLAVYTAPCQGWLGERLAFRVLLMTRLLLTWLTLDTAYRSRSALVGVAPRPSERRATPPLSTEATTANDALDLAL